LNPELQPLMRQLHWMLCRSGHLGVGLALQYAL
jgi:hypothetical protein